MSPRLPGIVKLLDLRVPTLRLTLHDAVRSSKELGTSWSSLRILKFLTKVPLIIGLEKKRVESGIVDGTTRVNLIFEKFNLLIFYLFLNFKLKKY